MGTGKGTVLVVPSATATMPPADGRAENVVPEPTAAAPPATMVVEPPTTICEELPSFSNVTPGTMATGRVAVAGVLVMGAGKFNVLVLPSATAAIPPADGRTEKVVPDPTAAAPPATMVVDPPTTILEELPSFSNVTPGTIATGRVVAVGTDVVAGITVTPLPPCGLVLVPGS